MQHLVNELRTLRDHADRLLIQAEHAAQLGAERVGVDEQVLGQLARQIHELRRTRSGLFGDLFAEPTWDMMLELFSAKVSGRSLSTMTLTAASAVPTTTALRHIANLEEAGLIERRSDPNDSRRTIVVLTEQASGKMRQYMSATASKVLDVSGGLRDA